MQYAVAFAVGLGLGALVVWWMGAANWPSVVLVGGIAAVVGRIAANAFVD